MDRVEKTIKNLRDSRERAQLIQAQQRLENIEVDLDKQKEELRRKEQQLSDDEVEKGKDVEHYAQTYAAFFNTRMEKDKSLFTFSVAGLGFLVTFMLPANPVSGFIYFLSFLAAMSYLFCIYYIINIFGGNAALLIDIITDSPNSGDREKKLKVLDGRVKWLFLTGISLSVFLGFYKAIMK